jgi:hypothetical protein
VAAHSDIERDPGVMRTRDPRRLAPGIAGASVKYIGAESFIVTPDTPALLRGPDAGPRVVIGGTDDLVHRTLLRCRRLTLPA